MHTQEAVSRLAAGLWLIEKTEADHTTTTSAGQVRPLRSLRGRPLSLASSRDPLGFSSGLMLLDRYKVQSLTHVFLHPTSSKVQQIS